MSTGVTVAGGAERFVNIGETVTAVALRRCWPQAPRTRHPARAGVRSNFGLALRADPHRVALALRGIRFPPVSRGLLSEERQLLMYAASAPPRPKAATPCGGRRRARQLTPPPQRSRPARRTR